MPTGSRFLLGSITLACLLGASGCTLWLPEVTHQPVLHNPFPQLSKVAVVPFFNQSDEPTVDGRAFAMAYFAELQGVPGFEVVPVGVVEEAVVRAGIDLTGPDEARRLARLLGVDAVVIGTVTDYSPYYPPRCGMRVEWYAANPGFHEIPAGYGLPWGTPLEEYIPDELVFEAEMALAREQLKTQTPAPGPLAFDLPPAPPAIGGGAISLPPPDTDEPPEPNAFPRDPFEADGAAEELPAPPATELEAPPAPGASGAAVATGASVATDPTGVFPPGPPPNWPDARGFTPPGPSPAPPPMLPHNGPVMTHTRIYRGNDPEFTAALASYVSFRDDARFGGWQSYLERSDDFIRFCAHLHLAEMLTARGGGGETRVVRRWSAGR